MTKGTLMKAIYSFIMLFAFIAAAPVNSATVEDFSRHLQYYNVKISPDGKHLAALVNVDGGKSLVFLDAKTFTITYTLNANKKSQPADYYWANNERVIIQVEQLRGALEIPLNFGELYAVNYDGRKARMIFGYRSKSSIGLSAQRGFLLDILKEDRKHVLIQAQKLSRKSDVLPRVSKLNIYSGKEKRVKTAPISYSQFLIDNEGIPRFVSGIDKNYNTKLFYSKGKGSDWQSFSDDFKGGFVPVAFTENNQSIYALKSKNGETQGLYKYDLQTQKETLLYRSELVEPTYSIKSNVNQVFGLRIDEDYPSYIYLDDNNASTKLHKAIFGAFKGDNVEITSATKGGKKVIVKVSGDINPGAFYLFDTVTMQARHLFNSAPWIKPQELAQVEPFRIKTPDGYTLNGFMTLPIGKSSNIPTIVLPHGGPHARDYWQYNRQVQMFANAGYAVIQVNFRGSTGYGDAFKEAGYENWGSKIQDDILLATKYAIQQGVADKNRLCIFGGSFGGYSALQSAIRSPDLFKCAIGYAGVYDLPLLYADGDITTLRWGDAYLNKTLGVDEAKQIAQSPIYHVDKLKAPVLIIHGEDDLRAPISHANKLRAALEQQNHPYEWLVKDKEGHGFYKEENLLEANKKILSFLEKYIGT
ncbi:S9 family peptidase [Colwellia sp. 39_35_sub15_T18]|nr:S9 family peptidase [Colwellia sp. 39_35_sub15_T18]